MELNAKFSEAGRIQRYYYNLVRYRYLAPHLTENETEYYDMLIELFDKCFEKCPVLKSIIIDHLTTSKCEKALHINRYEREELENDELFYLKNTIYNFEDKYYNMYMEA